MAMRLALKFARNCALNRNVKPSNVTRRYFCSEASAGSAQVPPPPTRHKVPHFSKKVKKNLFVRVILSFAVFFFCVLTCKDVII